MAEKKQNFILKIAQETSLRVKIILIFFVVLIFPCFFFTQYATRCVDEIMQQQTFSAAGKTFDETLSSVQRHIEKVSHVMDLLVYDDLIYRMASTDPRDYPYIYQLEDSRALSTSFHYLIHLSEISNIRLYVKNDYLYSLENKNIFSMEDIADTEWYQELLTAPSGEWFTPLDFAGQPALERQLFSSMRLIYDPGNPASPLAVLRVDLTQPALEQALNRTATTKNATMLLLSGSRNENQIILSSSNKDADALPKNISSSLSEIPQDTWSTVSVDGVEFYSYCTSLPPTGWKLAAVVPYSDIYSVSHDLRTQMIQVMLIIAVIAYAAALLLINPTLRRIGQLAASMQKVESGNMNVHFSSFSHDEIGQLTVHFNHMMNRIRDLMEEKVQQGLEIKNLELKALQAQINPHFLYNTLDTINCLAIQKDVPEIVTVVSSLAAFYRISLSKGADQIPIRDEIRHAKAYLKIQNARFEDRIKSFWEVDPSLEQLLMIKIILQPIIENAVLHGICEREDKSGTIVIRGWQEGNDVYITVTDNGVGMDAEKTASMFSPNLSTETAPTSSGYGLQNISDRLRLAYGLDFGLSCESTPKVGTTVTVHIPAVSPAIL